MVEKLFIFKTSKKEKGSIRYIGLNFLQMGKELFVNQNNYISSMKPVELIAERVSQKDEELRIEEKSKLRSVSRQLLWVTSQTFPDASFDSCRVSNYGKNPKVKNLLEANKAVKLQSSTLRLVYPDLRNPEYLKVIVYREVTHAGLPSGASQGTQTVFLRGNRRAVPITWNSKKLEKVTKIPMASETMALAESADADHFVALMTKEMFALKIAPRVFCKTDNKSLEKHLKSSKVIQDLWSECILQGLERW